MKLYRTYSNTPDESRIWRVCSKELGIVMWDDEPLRNRRNGGTGIADMFPIPKNSTLVFKHRC